MRARSERALDALRTLGDELQQLRVGAEPLTLVVMVRDLRGAHPCPTHPHAMTPIGATTVSSGVHEHVPANLRMDYVFHREWTVEDRGLDAGTQRERVEQLTPAERLAVLRTKGTYLHPIYDVVSRLGGLLHSNGWRGLFLQKAHAADVWVEALSERVLPDAAWTWDGGAWTPVEVGHELPRPFSMAFVDVAAASKQLIQQLEGETERRLAAVPYTTLEFLQGGSIVLHGVKLDVADSYVAVLRSLALARQCGVAEVARLPIGVNAAKRFHTRLSDMRNPKGKIKREFRAVLNRLPLPLFHATEPRFNPDLRIDIELP